MDALEIRKQFDIDLAKAPSPEDVVAVRIKYLGRKHGLVTKLFSDLANASVEEKKQLGPALNSLKEHIESALKLREKESSTQSSVIDFTVPAVERPLGHFHPNTLVQTELEDIFRALGFSVVYGPEIESDYYNFTALNIPKHHPARDMQDTFYVNTPPPESRADEQILLRTHISNLQVRFMEKHKPPFAIVAPGMVYRNEATDATHEHTYQYMEGLVVGDNVNYANMVWTLQHVLKKFFGDEVQTKLVPSYFPFVEPGAEMAMSTPKFKDGKWIEILGCGMVHQNVFEYAGYERNRYQGFAFGFGMSRFTIMKYGIQDIRLLAENNLQFLKQF